MPVRSEEPEADLRSKRSALLRVLTATRTLAAQVTFYAAALGAVALVGGATLPPELQFFAGAVGADILAGLITRLAQGESVPDEEIREQVEAAIAQSDLAGALAQQETQAMIGRLLSRMHLLHYALANGQADIAERLATQAAQYQTLFAELQGTVDRIDETTARIDANVSALLHRIQPPVDSAQQLASALALLATLPLDELPAVAPLPSASRMPFSPNPLFVGRADDLRTLARILQAGATAAVGQVAAATGLGGIGKTQLAVEFAHRYGRFFAGGVFWLSCSDPNAVATEVVACGLAMGLPAFDALDFPDQVRRVQQAWQEPIPRLLIFDNCEEEDVLAQWRPATGGCRVLTTSRRASWSAGLGVRSLALPVLPRAESVALLRQFRGDLAEGDPVLDEIAGELGDLPLALHLAGSFLARYRHDVTPAAYLDDLRRPDLLVHRSLVTGDWSPTGHEAHVARTFALSYDRLEPADPVEGLALALLARLVCFAPGEPVARGLLLLTMDRNVDGPDYEASDALRRLVELGLVDGQEDGEVVMHRLVAAFVGALAGAEEAHAAVEEALDWEAGRLNDTRLPGLLLPWQQHLRHVVDQSIHRNDLMVTRLCNRMGYHLNLAGDLPGARHYYEQDLSATRNALGEAHLSTASSLNNLGTLLHSMGDLIAARPYLEQALDIRRRALGDAHPDTATSLNNLGMVLKDTGDLPAARTYLEQALTIKRKALGEANPSTARSLNNIGTLLQAMGDLPAARSFLEQGLDINRQALGDDHPDTAASFNNLGTLLQAMGDLAAARTYLERALAIIRQTLSDAHPSTARSLNNLGRLLREIGDLPAARPYLEQALAIFRQVLGEDHPETAASLSNLGELFHDMDELPAARSYYERALVIRRQVLGDAHPHTAASLNNLGTLLQTMGELDSARFYYEQALSIRRQTLGDAHPSTAVSLNNLGTLFQAMGNLPEARTYLDQALIITRHALGEVHPSTAQSLNNLGMLFRAMGDLAEARSYLEQTVAIAEHSFGPDHPNTRIVRRNLEVLLDEMGTREAPD